MGVWRVLMGMSCRVAAVVAVAGGAAEFVVVEQMVLGMVLRLDDGRH